MFYVKLNGVPTDQDIRPRVSHKLVVCFNTQGDANTYSGQKPVVFSIVPVGTSQPRTGQSIEGVSYVAF